METVAEIGLLKMDFLGPDQPDDPRRAVEIIEQTRGEALDLQDAAGRRRRRRTRCLRRGETFGVFQLEVAGHAPLHPGTAPAFDRRPRGHGRALPARGRCSTSHAICRAKHGRRQISYPHPDLAEILDETYGVIVYQDQVLLIAQKFAGYTLGEADIMRKAMGKKIAEKMRAEHERFLDGARQKGYSERRRARRSST